MKDRYEFEAQRAFLYSVHVQYTESRGNVKRESDQALTPEALFSKLTGGL